MRYQLRSTANHCPCQGATILGLLGAHLRCLLGAGAPPFTGVRYQLILCRSLYSVLCTLKKVFRFPFSVFCLFFVSLHQISKEMKFKTGYKVRSMAGENVVIMQGTAGSDMTRIISLNDSSLLLWNELQDKEFEVADVAKILVDTYEIDAEVAERDAAAWVAKLHECNLIEE